MQHWCFQLLFSFPEHFLLSSFLGATFFLTVKCPACMHHASYAWCMSPRIKQVKVKMIKSCENNNMSCSQADEGCWFLACYFNIAITKVLPYKSHWVVNQDFPGSLFWYLDGTQHTKRESGSTRLDLHACRSRIIGLYSLYREHSNVHGSSTLRQLCIVLSC